MSSTATKRRQISPSNLHISSFVVAKKKETDSSGYSILLLRAGNKHPLSFRRGKLLLPSTILNYGERPRDATRRALALQLENYESTFSDPQFLTMQSWYGAHWDIVFLYETWLKDGAQNAGIPVKEPYVEARFYSVSSLPRGEISDDHLEVLDGMFHPSGAI